MFIFQVAMPFNMFVTCIGLMTAMVGIWPFMVSVMMTFNIAFCELLCCNWCCISCVKTQDSLQICVLEHWFVLWTKELILYNFQLGRDLPHIVMLKSRERFPIPYNVDYEFASALCSFHCFCTENLWQLMCKSVEWNLINKLLPVFTSYRLNDRIL